MKRFIGILLAALVLVGAGVYGLDVEAQEGGGLKVYASFFVMSDFAAKIGGDRVTVTTMVPSGMEPHDWEPTPADIVGLENADILIYNGAGMEHWVEDVLGSLSNSSLVAVEASKGVELREGHGHEDEPDEESYDPHVWLDPLNAKIEMENIKNALAQADPDNADYYAANYETYAGELDALDQEFRDALTPLANKDIVVTHQAFGYLCAAYGLNQVAIEGLTPDSEPDPARVAEIIDFGKEHSVKVIFFEELVSPKVAKTIADAIGAGTDVLSPVEGLSDEQAARGDDYFAVMRQNLKALVAALS